MTQPTIFPTYDPFVPVDRVEPTNISGIKSATTSATTNVGPPPTRVPIELTFERAADSNRMLPTPTPDSPHKISTARSDVDHYIIQAGDTLAQIALAYGLSANDLIEANNISDPDALEIGSSLVIPAPSPDATGTDFKIIPDSEFVYSPSNALFDLDEFIRSKAGHLSAYSEDVNGELLTGSQIILRVSKNYSINPRLLLAILEHQSGWVSDSNPAEFDYPIGLVDAYHNGLYLQLTWTADTLNRGFYSWRVDAVPGFSLADGNYLLVEPTINAGTAGIQYFFSKLDDLETWFYDSSETGLFLTYWVLFGNPFQYVFEPLIPKGLQQPPMSLPFDLGQTWSFTGGPHGGWDSGSGWAALDFAPPGDTASCLPSESWATAVADGLILRADHGAVILDLDNDGFEQTGWVVLYMHIDSHERIEQDTYVYAGDRIGHPSCEGGLSNGTHVHLARRYNGEWIPADGPIPFELNGWISSGIGIEYDGYLRRDQEIVEAWDGINALNQISH